MSLFKTNTTKDCKPTHANNVYDSGKKPRKLKFKKKQSEDNITKNVRKSF